MKTLRLNNIPDELYARLETLANEHHRSMSEEVIQLLIRTLDKPLRRDQQLEILEEIRRNRFTPPADMPNSTELLREDRER